MQIRGCKIEDFDDILKLLYQLWPQKMLHPELLREVYERGICSKSNRYICAITDSKIVGFASLTVKGNLWQEGYLGHIDELVVDEPYRRQGIGTRLLEHMIDLARRMDCRRIEVESALYRTDAHKFYEQRGFENRAYLFSKALQGGDEEV